MRRRVTVGSHRAPARPWRVNGVPRDLWLAGVLLAGSTAGDMAAQAVLTLSLHDLGGSGTTVSALLLANSVPVLLTAPLAGRLADRVDSRPLLVGCATVCALLCLVLAGVAGRSGVAARFGVLVLIAAVAAVSAVCSAVLGALVPRIAGRAGVVKATTLLRGAIMVSGVAGLAVGSGCGARFGTGPVLVADALSFAALGVGALFIRARRGGGPLGPAAAGPGGLAHWRALAPDVRDRAALPWLITLSYASVLLLVSTTNVAQVFFVKDVLHAGDLGFGVISGCWTVGTLLALPVMRRAAADPEVLARLTLCGEGVVALAVLGCGLCATVGATVVMYVLGGAGTCIMQIARGSFLQLTAPEDRRGRQLAGYNAVVKAASIGALGLGGALIDMLGGRGVYLAAGAGALLVAALAGLAWALRSPLTVARGSHRRADGPPGPGPLPGPLAPLPGPLAPLPGPPPRPRSGLSVGPLSGLPVRPLPGPPTGQRHRPGPRPDRAPAEVP
jgi:MFS family permease